MVLELMKSASSGLTSTEILEKIEISYGKELSRTSLSPQLSRLKDEGRVSLIDNRWFLSDQSFVEIDPEFERRLMTPARAIDQEEEESPF